MQEVSCNLNNCFLCSNCIPEWKQAIAAHKKTLLFKKGKQVFREGEKVNGIYFIYTGSVKVHKKWGEEKELIIRFSGAGDILGHRGLGGSDIYPISATALEDTRACYISYDFFEATLKTNPSFTYTLMQFYAAELQIAEQRMRDLAHMEVKGRTAAALLHIAEQFGLDKENYIAVAITRQDIASFAGTTYETVFKFFNELIAAGIISTSGKSIRIDKPEQLKDFITNHH